MSRYKTLSILLVGQTALLYFSKFTAWPEMLLWPFLILNGWLPYQDIAIAHTPLLFTDLTIWYSLVGLGVTTLKIYTWLLLAITAVSIWFCVSSNTVEKRIRASVAVFTYIYLVVIYEGNGLWFEHLVGLLALVTYLFIERKHYFSAGVATILMILTKQTGVWFLPAIGLSIFHRTRSIHEYLKYCFAILITAGLFLSVIFLLGIEQDFWQWVVEFGIGVLPHADGQVVLPSVRQLFIAVIPYSILVPAYFLLKTRRELIIWTIVGVFGVYPRWELFHFLPSLPFLAIIVGELTRPEYIKKSLFGFLIIIYIMTISLLFGRSYLRNIDHIVRFAEPDVVAVSQYINAKREGTGTIYILNDWDSIYPFSQSLPATKPWYPHLSWYMELKDVQNNIVSDLQNNKPALIIMKDFTKSGLGSYKPLVVLEEISKNYVLEVT